MKKLVVLFSFIMFAGSSLSAQKKSLVPVHMDPIRLEKLDKLIQTYVDNNTINGAVAVIHRNNELVYHKAFGYFDVETQKPMPRDAIFRIASQTKAITATAIMQLYEEGKLLLDDPIEKYLPSFASPRVIASFNFTDTSYTTIPAKRSVTIRDLLTHTSGIGYAQIGNDTARALYGKFGVVGGIGVTNPKIRLADQINMLGSIPLMHQPGAKWTYGLNIDVLGRLVEVLSGQDLASFFKTRIFDPLEMNDTYFYQPASNWLRIVPLHSSSASNGIVKLPTETSMLGGLYTAYPSFKGTYFSGGAGLSCTAMDYAQFLQMMLNDGIYKGKRILSRASVKLMRSNQIGDVEFAMPGQQLNNKVGFGFIITTEKASAQSPASVGTFFGGGAFYSIYWIDPIEKITGQLMVNMLPMSDADLLEKFKLVTYQAIQD